MVVRHRLVIAAFALLVAGLAALQVASAEAPTPTLALTCAAQHLDALHAAAPLSDRPVLSEGCTDSSDEICDAHAGTWSSDEPLRSCASSMGPTASADDYVPSRLTPLLSGRGPPRA